MAALIVTETDKSSMAHMVSTIEQRALALEVFVGGGQVEAALDTGDLRVGWEELLARDSVASFYQTPIWCVTWYRCYLDEFEPFLLTAKQGGRLVGLAPLARERSTGRILFAGNNMTDYRDFVCADGFRREAIELFLPRIMSETPSGVFVVGQTQPESQTVELVQQWAAHHKKRFGTIIRSHPCWRFRLESSEETMDLYKKKTLRQAVAYYKRRGELKLKRISECREWNDRKSTFFQQQCLREAFAERPISFANPAKQSFYGQLFESQAPEIHFSGLLVAGKPISFMFCFAYRGVLYYGAPCFDLLELKHSPGLVHILEAITQCRNKGYREVDLTIGSASFKSRIGNYCVTLPSVYIYSSFPLYLRSLLNKAVLDSAKRVIRKLTGSGIVWESAKILISRLRRLWQRVKETPIRRVLSVASSRLGNMIFYRYVGEVFQLSPDGLIPAEPRLLLGEKHEYRKNRLEDFLTLQGKERRAIGLLVQEATKRIAKGHRLHTILVDDRLAHYGWSYRPDEPVWLPETETALNCDDGAVSLYDFYTCEAYRGRRLYQANLTHLIKEVFAAGQAKTVYIVCEVRNTASRNGIVRTGFQHRETHRMKKFLGLKWSRVLDKG